MDDNNDAFPELAAEAFDTDNDSIGNNADPDDDNDGVPDLSDSFPLDAGETVDTDNDGIGNNQDTDDDNDGYSDAIELQYESDALDANTLPLDLDSDRDTLADSLERGSDADGDGIGNEFDIDSDNDGIFDLLEASASPAEAAMLDSNNDGSMDSTELRGLIRTARPEDTDGDGIFDFRDLDSDNDGISDASEVTSVIDNFISINNLRSDQPSAMLADPDGDFLVNYRDLDSDNDGIPDIVEAGGEDIDDNGLIDSFLDINVDGFDDAYFIAPLALPDTDADGTQDYLDLDSDNDGILDVVATGFVDADLNGDGRLDISSDINSNGILDYADVAITNGVDSDADGIDDRIDASILNEADTDSDGIADRFDADIEGDGFIQIASILYPEPEVLEASPVAIATTSVSGGGCSIAGPAIPDITLTTLLVFSFIYLTLVRIGTVRTLKSSLLIFISTCLAAGPTMADVQTGLYLGLGGGASRLMPEITNAVVDDRDSIGNTWNTTAGFQLNRTLGVELEYTNLGTTELDPIGFIDYQNLNISGLYHFGGVASAIGGKKFSLYGRLGVGTIRNQSNIQLNRGSNAHILAGAGVQIPVSSRLSLRAEGVNYDSDVSRVGVSLVYRMGRISLDSLKPLAMRLGLGKSSDTDATIASAATQLPSSDEKFDERMQDQAQRPELPASGNNDIPLALGAHYHQPHQSTTPSIEEMMTIEPRTTKRWAISENKLKSMLATAESDQDERAAEAVSLEQDPSEALTTNTDTITQASIDTTADMVSDSSLLSEPTKMEIPTLQSAMPVESETVETLTADTTIPATAENTEAIELNNSLPDDALKPVLFNFDDNTLSPLFQSSLQPLVDYLLTTADAKVTLTGHTDSIGSSEYNQALSLQRARAVEQFLLQQGIDKKMIRTLGMGEKRPAQSNDKPSGRRANRRVTIVMD